MAMTTNLDYKKLITMITFGMNKTPSTMVGVAQMQAP